jgi:pimeloyl-ACP methyl ester carboxylesterase
MEKQLQLRVQECRSLRHGNARTTASACSRPTLIYLPGLHGDWTLLGGFRQAVGDRARLVELTYPRSLTWSLDDYAAEIESLLQASGIDAGWLLGESYGSQVAWQIAGRGRFKATGIILAGGFVRHPLRWGVRLASLLLDSVSPPLMKPLLYLYAKVSSIRFRGAPEVVLDMDAFLERRTDLDRRAARHRLDLIAGNDPSPIARRCRIPVYSITGLLDPIVPWLPVHRWLVRSCPGLREQKIVWLADHTVLATAPGIAAGQILEWIQESDDSTRAAGGKWPADPGRP